MQINRILLTSLPNIKPWVKTWYLIRIMYESNQQINVRDENGMGKWFKRYLTGKINTFWLILVFLKKFRGTEQSHRKTLFPPRYHALCSSSSIKFSPISLVCLNGHSFYLAANWISWSATHKFFGSSSLVHKVLFLPSCLTIVILLGNHVVRLHDWKRILR